MQIILNNALESHLDEYQKDLSYRLTSMAAHQHPNEKGRTYKVVQGATKSTLNNSGLVGLLSQCYSQHLPVAIAPHDIWVLMLSEVTKEVASNVEQYRDFFTQSSAKETISVPSGSLIEMPMSILAQALQEKVLFDSNIIFQNFSTETSIITETIQAIFCDMASPYYNYSMFDCGIPSIQLLGTVQDWEKVLSGFTTIVETFKTQALVSYLVKVKPILEQFIKGSKGDVDTDFWKDIFTQKNVGSGGELEINGWITKLFVADNDFALITNFTGTNGVVKYTQEQTQEKFVAIYGGFHTKLNNKGFYELEYSKFILQDVAQ